jgi:hypothetical protein
MSASLPPPASASAPTPDSTADALSSRAADGGAVLTLVAGAVAAALAGIAWALLVGFSERAYGVLASCVGLAVGFAMTQFLRSSARWLPVAGALIALVTVPAATYVGEIIILSRGVHIPFMDAARAVRTVPELRSAVADDMFGPIDFLFWGLAALAAFGMIRSAQDQWILATTATVTTASPVGDTPTLDPSVEGGSADDMAVTATPAEAPDAHEPAADDFRTTVRD